MAKGPATQRKRKRINTKKLKEAKLTGPELDGAIMAFIAMQKNPSDKAIVGTVKKRLRVSVSERRVAQVRRGNKVQSKPHASRVKKSAASEQRESIDKLIVAAVDHRTERHDGTLTYTNTSTTHIRQYLSKNGVKKVPCKQTILNRLGALGFVRRRRPSRCHNGSAKDKAKRLCFSKVWKDVLCSEAARKKVIFSDEHNLSTNWSGDRYAFVRRGTQTIDMLPVDKADWRNVPHVQVFGAIGVGWRSPLINVSNLGGKRMNSKQYKEKCLRKIRPHISQPGMRFVQDGATCHRTLEVRKYCERAKINLVENWPARSPDLNPIEDVWALLDKKIQDNHPEGTAQKTVLLRWAQEAWNGLDQSVLDNLVLSFQRRVEKCIHTGGDIVKA